MSKTLFAVGRSLLIVAGGAFGLLRGLRVLANVTRNAAGIETLQAQLDTLHLAVARLGGQTGELQTKVDQSVTNDELSLRLDRLFAQLEQGVDARFEHQTRSVEALRIMVGQTDELLQRVLDGMESMQGESRPWDLTEAAH